MLYNSVLEGYSIKLTKATGLSVDVIKSVTELMPDPYTDIAKWAKDETPRSINQETPDAGTLPQRGSRLAHRTT